MGKEIKRKDCSESLTSIVEGRVVSVRDALQKGTPVRSAMRAAPEETERAVLALAVKSFEHIGAVRKIDTAEGFVILLSLIVDTHPQMTLEELVPFFRGLISGRWGPHFNSADVAWVMTCLNKYVEEVQAPAREQINRAPPSRGVQSGTKDIYKGQRWKSNQKTRGERLRDILGNK